MAIQVNEPFKVVAVKKDASPMKMVVKSLPREVILRLDIDPADAAHQDDLFVLRSKDKTYTQLKRIKDDHTPGDKFVDLLFTMADPALEYSLEVESGEHKHFVFENVKFSALTGLKGVEKIEAEEQKPTGEGEMLLRLQIDPADAKEEKDSFVLKGSSGWSQKKTIADDQTPGDQFVDLKFTGLPKADTFSLEVTDAKGTHTAFEGVTYAELSHVSGDLPVPSVGPDVEETHNTVPAGVSLE